MTDVRSEMTATVWKIRVSVGDQVDAADELVVLESMKMEIPVTAPRSGEVAEICVGEQDQVAQGDLLLRLV